MLWKSDLLKIELEKSTSSKRVFSIVVPSNLLYCNEFSLKMESDILEPEKLLLSNSLFTKVVFDIYERPNLFSFASLSLKTTLDNVEYVKSVPFILLLI